MDIYGSDALGSRNSARGPQRVTADSYYAPSAPAQKLALVPAPKPAAQAQNPAEKQVAAQNAAAERMAAQMAEMQAQLKAMSNPAPAPAGQTSGPGMPTLPGQTPSTSPAQVPGLKGGFNGGTNPVPMGTPAAVSKGNPIAGPRRGFALSPEDAWLARLGFHADNWLDLHPTARAMALQQTGCDLNAINSVANALNSYCGRRTGRDIGPMSGNVRGTSPVLAPGPTAVTIQSPSWPNRFGYQPVRGAGQVQQQDRYGQSGIYK